MTPPVPRIGRVLDVVGLVLFLVGAGVYGRAWLGMQRLESVQPVSLDVTDFAALARFDELHQLSRVGLGIMAAGVLMAVAAMVVAKPVGGKEPHAEGDGEPLEGQDR